MNRNLNIFVGIILCSSSFVLTRIGLADATAARVFGKYGSVRVDVDRSYPLDQRWGSNWPDGIKLANNIQASFPRAIKFHNTTGYPYTLSETTTQVSNPPLTSTRRTYLWSADELIITCNMTANIAYYPTCTRLVPSSKWLTLSGAKIAPIDNEINRNMNSDLVEIRVGKQIVENNLGILRSSGFAREDIFRMLDKGPWILACDISQALNALFADLQRSLGINDHGQCVHIISHCPYLLAQYIRYRGRDVGTTVQALLDIGYKRQNLLKDVLRFPSILSASPERLYGWLNLLQKFNIAENSSDFGKMLSRASFIFYLDPPYISDLEANCGGPVLLRSPAQNRDKDSLNSIISYETLHVLNVLDNLQLPLGYLDKIVRTQPMILLCEAKEVSCRLELLKSLLGEYTGVLVSKNLSKRTALDSLHDATVDTDDEIVQPKDLFGQRNDWLLSNSLTDTIETSDFNLDSDTFAEERDPTSQNIRALHELLMSYPKVLSIPYRHLKTMTSTLRAGGFTRSEIVHLLKKHPYVFQQSPEIIQNLLIFLKSYCGLRKVDIVPFLLKNPSLFKVDIDTLQPKVDYLFQSLGGTPATLRRFPSYLSFSLDDFIRPRSEFLRAFRINPLFKDLQFLLTTSQEGLAEVANVSPDAFPKFCNSFRTKWIASAHE